MDIKKISKEIHQNNLAKGFYDSEKNIGEMLALVHSEVSKVLECDRNGRYCNVSNVHVLNSIGDDEKFKRSFVANCKDTFEDELADIMIRVMDLAEFKGIDLESHILAKIRYNTLRPYKHGKKY